MQLQFDRGAHVCHLFETRNEQREVTLRFIQEGLSRGEYCPLITADPAIDACYAAFQASDKDAPPERRRGALEVLNAVDWYLGSDFHSVAQARRLWRMLEASLGLFDGVRLLTDMGWTIENLSTERLCHWEATTNLILENVEVRALCQYDLNLHAPAAIHSALRTHPLVILGGRTLPSPYYEAPEILAREPDLNGSDADAGDVEAMLTKLRDS